MSDTLQLPCEQLEALRSSDGERSRVASRRPTLQTDYAPNSCRAKCTAYQAWKVIKEPGNAAKSFRSFLTRWMDAGARGDDRRIHSPTSLGDDRRPPGIPPPANDGPKEPVRGAAAPCTLTTSPASGEQSSGRGTDSQHPDITPPTVILTALHARWPNMSALYPVRDRPLQRQEVHRPALLLFALYSYSWHC